MPPRAVLLDLYDTVVYGNWAEWRDEMAAITGVDGARIATAYTATRPMRNTGSFADAGDDTRAVLVAAGLEPTGDLVDAVLDAERRFDRSRVFLFEESLDVITTLRERGHALALVSNCSRGTREVVDSLGLSSVFDAVILSFEVGSLKPEPVIYRAALQALEASPTEALFVDDQTPFCDGARALGIDTRLVIRPTLDPPEGYATTTNGHRVIASLRELL
jgi:putative hydrolase of the HAD superfamily